MSSDEIQNLLEEFGKMQKTLENAEMAVEKKNTELSLSNKILLDNTEELEKTKRAVLNVLEDLEIEKAGVEKKVTERTRELKEEQAKFITAVNVLPRGFVLVGTKRNILFANPALGQILELSGSPESWTAADIEKKFHGILDIWGECTVCQTEKNSKVIKELAWGKKFLDLYFSPVIMLKDHEEVIGNIILIGDITEAKIIERSREEFFAVASHEMRTPLTAIRGNMALIKQFFADKLQDKELAGMIDDSYNASIRLIGIVNDFLDAARLEHGHVEFKKEKVEIMELLREVLREVAELAKSKKLVLSLKDSEGVKYFVMGDRDRVKQILYNLISNALNYTQKGGVTVEVKKENSELKIFVIDTGAGISIQNQALLFRKFQQAGEKVLARDITKSTGLGLYISKLIVEGMGGKIWLERSEAGNGSVFAFALPLAT